MAASGLYGVHSSNSNGQRAPLVALQRKEKQLQDELQLLLTVQEEGLQAGLHQSPSADTSSDATGSVRGSSRRSTGKASRARRQRREHISLRDARTGILAAMRELAIVKDEELASLQARSEDSRAVLGQLDDWARKKAGLREEIELIEHSPDAVTLQKFKGDEKMLQEEVQDLEDRLVESKARHRRLLAEISRISNSVEARLSSYQASLSLMDDDIRQFLSKPPTSGLDVYGKSPPAFMRLPDQRRTLAMAQEHWVDDGESLGQKIEQVERERDALEDGAGVWEDVASAVTMFEKSLRRALRPASTAPTHPLDGERQAPTAALRELAPSLDKVVHQLEDTVKAAEARNWKLLVCCVGAELEAMNEAKSILPAFSQPSSMPRREAGHGSQHLHGYDKLPTAAWLRADGVEDNALEALAERDEYHDSVEKTDDEDNDPDPNLLVSHGLAG
ncbi:MAG: hypothetical protein M1826_000060 [Phylliscum demangeonii]|nr:MAG: hypothetical protein M1826_000060 [Phylliscum demangeonii]